MNLLSKNLLTTIVFNGDVRNHKKIDNFLCQIHCVFTTPRILQNNRKQWRWMGGKWFCDGV